MNNVMLKTISILSFLICFSHLNAQYQAPSSASVGTGANNTVVGTSAGTPLMTGNNNSFFGWLSGSRNESGSSNAFFGARAGLNNTTGGGNAMFGSMSGFDNSSGSNNSYFGFGSGLNNETGADNTFIGYRAGATHVDGNRNTFIGSRAGDFTETGNNNLFVGYQSGVFNISGVNNCFIGMNSGSAHEIGINNTYLGTSSGGNLAGTNNSNICIGSNSGPANLQSLSNRLFVDVVPSDDPLIYGEFDNDFIRINGTFEVTAGLSNPSDVNLKNNFEEVDEEEILSKISGLDIQKWTYKDRQEETHIGATAQDFYKAFGLGNDDTHISTIDADGVALAAIKALKNKNDKLMSIIEALEKRIVELENK